MSAERPEAGGPAQPSPDASVPPESEVAAPSSAEPTLPQHTVEPTRTSMVWTMIGLGVVLAFAILVFILQNGQRVRVRFLMVNGTLPLGAALLFCCAERCTGEGRPRAGPSLLADTEPRA
jgi:uncharacterized integral membrane protein